jgi:hypothetical protein
MSDISKLEHNEKVFLAGCVKTMLLSDGNISQAEIDDINKLYNAEHFDDFEECLTEFENKISDEEGFLAAAKEITNPDAQDTILGQLFSISIDDGVQSTSEAHILNKLKDFWGK